MEVWNVLLFMLNVLRYSTSTGVSAQTWIRADATNDTYAVIDKALGSYATRTVPDCRHNVKHITMANDEELKRQVFCFHLHVDLDDDYGRNGDRQRTEISPDDNAPNAVKILNHDTFSYSWNFKLDAKFQASSQYTYIPKLTYTWYGLSYFLIALDVRKEPTADVLRIIHFNHYGVMTVLGETALAPFKGTWVHVQENATIANVGNYSISLTKVSDGSNLFNVTKSNLDMWKNGAMYVIPKWGIYRNLTVDPELRDEIVRFDNICLAKGTSVCQ